MRLNGKTALVTGASRGIGRAISIALAQESASVILAARSMETLKETAQHVTKAGGQPHIIVTDLSDEQSIINLVRQTEKTFGKLDILINNAGITHSARLEDTTTADWEKCFRINARAPFILCREALSLLKKPKSAHIINIASSVVSGSGYPMQSAYAASKHALRGMSIVLADELKGSNIRVHIISPGGVETDMVTKVRPDIKTEDLIQPHEIAELVVYLVTHKGNAVMDELRLRRAAANPWF